jgi:hypothetical protein
VSILFFDDGDGRGERRIERRSGRDHRKENSKQRKFAVKSALGK